MLSVHIPTYRQPHTLRRALDSALAQDYPHLEVIISDDDPSSPAPDWLPEYSAEPRLRYYKNIANLGRVANYHQGLHHLASGTWFLNIDGDDFLVDPTFLSRAMAALEAQPDPASIVALSAGRRSEGSGAQTSPTLEFPEQRRLSSREAFLDYTGRDGRYLTHLTTLVRRSTAIDCGFYTRDLLSADLHGLRLLVLRGDVVLIPGVVGVWAQTEDSASHAPPLRALLDNFASFYLPYLEARRHSLPPADLAAWLDLSCRQYLNNLAHYRSVHRAPRLPWVTALLFTALHRYPRALPPLLRHIAQGRG